MRTVSLLVSLFVLFFSTSSTSAGTIYVPGDYPTIQEAINAALDADIIVVDPGFYPETLKVSGKSITLYSPRGAVVQTTRPWAPTLEVYEVEHLTVYGFRFVSSPNYHAVQVQNARDAWFEHCEFVSNSAAGQGLSVSVVNSELFHETAVVGCRFSGPGAELASNSYISVSGMYRCE